MEIYDIDEEMKIETFHQLYLMNIYALEQLKNYDLKKSSICASEFLEALYHGMQTHLVLTSTVAHYKALKYESERMEEEMTS